MKSELDFVNYLKKIKTFNKNIIEGIGDDCAIVKFSSRKKYVITSDTSVAHLSAIRKFFSIWFFDG